MRHRKMKPFKFTVRGFVKCLGYCNCDKLLIAANSEQSLFTVWGVGYLVKNFGDSKLLYYPRTMVVLIPDLLED